MRSCHGTGKTYVSGRVVPLFLDAYWPSKVVTTAPSNTQVEKLLWGEINKACLDAGNFPGRCLNKELKIAPDHYAIGFSTDEAVNFQGFHSKYLLTVVDEACGVRREIFNQIDTLMTSEGAKQLLIGNPDDSTGRFFESFENPAFHKIIISAFSTPNFTEFCITQQDIESNIWQEKITGPLPAPYLITPAWVYDKFLSWGPDSPLYQAKVLAEFPTSSISGLIPLSWIEKAQSKQNLELGRHQFGLDVARFGDDRSILTYRIGHEVVRSWMFRKLDTLELSNWIEGLVKETDKEALIVIDGVGIGAGVYDNLYHRGFQVFEYKGSASPHHSEDVINERAEFYWYLREIFQREEIGGNIDEETKQELAATNYKYRSGKIQIQEKEEIKKELGRSPDKADALMLAFAPIAVDTKEEHEDFDIIYEDSYAKEGKF